MWESFRHLLVSEGIFALYSIILNAEKQESCICFWLMRVKRIRFPNPHTKKGLPLVESPFLRL